MKPLFARIEEFIEEQGSDVNAYRTAHKLRWDPNLSAKDADFYWSVIIHIEAAEDYQLYP